MVHPEGSSKSKRPKPANPIPVPDGTRSRYPHVPSGAHPDLQYLLSLWPMAFGLFTEYPFLSQVFSLIGIRFFFKWASQWFDIINNFVYGRVATATIRESDVTYHWLHLWLSTRTFGEERIQVSAWMDMLESVVPLGLVPTLDVELTTKPLLPSALEPDVRPGSKKGYDRAISAVNNSASQQTIHVYPAHDTPIKLTWKGYTYTFTLINTLATRSSAAPIRGIRIKTRSRTCHPFLALIEEAKQEYITKHRNTITIWGADGSRWNKSKSRPGRPWETVILPQSVKDPLLHDCREFLKARDFYRERGLPHRRGYMLYGVPGSGKSSIIAGIATELELDIYTISLSGGGMGDVWLQNLLAEVPPNSIVVLEDIDCAVPSREEKSKKSSSSSKHRIDPEMIPRTVTLSGLLNAIDGLASSEARLLFCTTNHLELIDPALSRAGRCDVWIEFKNATVEQIIASFKHFFLDDPPTRVEVPTNPAVLDEKLGNLTLVPFVNGHTTDTPKSIDEMAKLFAEAIPAGGVTIAQLQGYFMRFKDDPIAALENVEEWVESGYEQATVAPVMIGWASSCSGT